MLGDYGFGCFIYDGNNYGKGISIKKAIRGVIK